MKARHEPRYSPCDCDWGLLRPSSRGGEENAPLAIHSRTRGLSWCYCLDAPPANLSRIHRQLRARCGLLNRAYGCNRLGAPAAIEHLPLHRQRSAGTTSDNRECCRSKRCHTPERRDCDATSGVHRDRGHTGRFRLRATALGTLAVRYVAVAGGSRYPGLRHPRQLCLCRWQGLRPRRLARSPSRHPRQRFGFLDFSGHPCLFHAIRASP